MTYFSSIDHQDNRVALVKCATYEALPEALDHGFNLLGGIEQFYSPGETLLLKPNLLLGDKPERGSTTNPRFFEAVADVFLSAGARLTYGDSSGVGSPLSAVRASGLYDIAEARGMTLADFVETVNIPNPNGVLLKQFLVAKGLLNVDSVVNLPKLKTHALTRMTGAVKNLFGCLPGVQKAGFHARIPDEIRFGEMLVDLAELISPRINIMDGIMGMEGNGPRNGRVRPVGVIFLSANPHALDHVVAGIMNLDPGLVPTLKAAKEYGYYYPEDVEILGESIENCVLYDFDVNRSRASTTGSQLFYMDVFKNWVTPRPVIDPEQCTKCGRCVRVCPATPKAIQFHNGRDLPPQYNYNDCFRCYCCQELCPDEAISIKTPLIGRLLNKIHL